MSANKTGGVETTTLSKVPESEKKSWYSIAFICNPTFRYRSTLLCQISYEPNPPPSRRAFVFVNPRLNVAFVRRKIVSAETL